MLYLITVPVDPLHLVIVFYCFLFFYLYLFVCTSIPLSLFTDISSFISLIAQFFFLAFVYTPATRKTNKQTTTKQNKMSKEMLLSPVMKDKHRKLK